LLLDVGGEGPLVVGGRQVDGELAAGELGLVAAGDLHVRVADLAGGPVVADQDELLDLAVIDEVLEVAVADLRGDVAPVEGERGDQHDDHDEDDPPARQQGAGPAWGGWRLLRLGWWAVVGVDRHWLLPGINLRGGDTERWCT